VKSYIVRIYREDRENPRSLIGVVEEPGKDGKKAFTNIDELWEIFNCGKKSCRDRKVRTLSSKNRED